MKNNIFTIIVPFALLLIFILVGAFIGLLIISFIYAGIIDKDLNFLGYINIFYSFIIFSIKIL